MKKYIVFISCTILAVGTVNFCSQPGPKKVKKVQFTLPKVALTEQDRQQNVKLAEIREGLAKVLDRLGKGYVEPEIIEGVRSLNMQSFPGLYEPTEANVGFTGMLRPRQPGEPDVADVPDFLKMLGLEVPESSGKFIPTVESVQSSSVIAAAKMPSDLQPRLGSFTVTQSDGKEFYVLKEDEKESTQAQAAPRPVGPKLGSFTVTQSDQRGGATVEKSVKEEVHVTIDPMWQKVIEFNSAWRRNRFIPVALAFAPDIIERVINFDIKKPELDDYMWQAHDIHKGSLGFLLRYLDRIPKEFRRQFLQQVIRLQQDS